MPQPIYLVSKQDVMFTLRETYMENIQHDPFFTLFNCRQIEGALDNTPIVQQPDHLDLSRTVNIILSYRSHKLAKNTNLVIDKTVRAIKLKRIIYNSD